MLGPEQSKQNPLLPKETSNFFSTRFIRFLGGKNLLFLLLVLLTTGCIIFIFHKVSFIFQPLSVLFEVVILPGVLGVILYYLTRPFLRLLMKWKIPKVWAIAIIYLVAIGSLTLTVVLVYPFLREQFTNLMNEFPLYFMAFVENIVSWLNNSHLNTYFQSIDFEYDKVITNLTDDIVNQMRDFATGFATNVASGVTGFLSALTGFVLSLAIVPFILFYLLYEGEKMPDFILRLVPPKSRLFVREVLHDMDKQISLYIQGQILVSICIGAMVTIGFLVIGLDYALLLGVLAMLTSVVPYLGPVIAITPAVILALVSDSSFMIVKLAIVWTIVQLIEGKFISPQIMGKSLSIHPITIIFVLLTMGSLFGVPGVILGIPTYALLKVVICHFYEALKRRYNRFQIEEYNKYEE